MHVGCELPFVLVVWTVHCHGLRYTHVHSLALACAQQELSFSGVRGGRCNRDAISWCTCYCQLPLLRTLIGLCALGHSVGSHALIDSGLAPVL